MTYMGIKDFPDKFHQKSDYDDTRIPKSYRVYFPRPGENHLKGYPKLFIQNYPRLEMDIKRLAVRLGTIDQQWIIRNMLHMCATNPLQDFNDFWNIYVKTRTKIQKEKEIKRRANHVYSPQIKIANAGGIDWLVRSKLEGRTMKKCAQILDINESSIKWFLETKYDTKWSEL